MENGNRGNQFKLKYFYFCICFLTSYNTPGQLLSNNQLRVCHLLRDIRSLHKRFITWNWLIKIISMINKSRSFLTKSDLAVWANQKSNSSCPSCASCRAILIDSQIGSYNNSVSSIPIWRRYPIESINKSISGSIAGVDTSCT